MTSISLDYTYTNVDAKESAKPILAMHDGKYKSGFGHLANCKGAGDDWLAKRVVSVVERLGYSSAKILLETDREPAIVDFQNKVMP